MMTTVIQPHPLYKNYGSTRDGSVYNQKGHKMKVGTRQNDIMVSVYGKQIAISHRLFVWQCFNGKLPIRLKVIFNNNVNGDFCDKLIAVNATENDIRKREQVRRQMITAGYFAHPTFTNYVSNKYGQVYSLYTNKELLKKPNPYGYIQLRLLNDIGTTVFKYKHILLCGNQ